MSRPAASVGTVHRAERRTDSHNQPEDATVGSFDVIEADMKADYRSVLALERQSSDMVTRRRRASCEVERQSHLLDTYERMPVARLIRKHWN